MTQTFTPAMQQYVDIKKQHPDCIIFFRLGDFYETFFDDAKTCSSILDLVLTSKNKTSENPIPMAGIPYHSVDKYIHKLLQHGHKIAMVEQTSKPVPGKLVDREVVSIITPGTYIHEHIHTYTFLVAISIQVTEKNTFYHIAWGDFSVGEYRTKTYTDRTQMQQYISTLRPAECIIDVAVPDKDILQNMLESMIPCRVTIYDIPTDPEQYTMHHCGVQSIESFGKALQEGRVGVFALLISYIVYTQKKQIMNIAYIRFHGSAEDVYIDETTIKNLEVFMSSYESTEKYSLYGVINNTQTAGGARLLRMVLQHPIQSLPEIMKRQDYIQHFQQDIRATQHIHTTLRGVIDIPRIISHIVYRKTLRGMVAKLRKTLGFFFSEYPELLQACMHIGCTQKTSDAVRTVYTLLDRVLCDDEMMQQDMNFVRDGYDAQIDAGRKIAFHSDELLLAYQQELVSHFGIGGIKVKYVLNQGYFLEVTNKDIDALEKAIVPDDDKLGLLRRQTLKGSQRYVSAYLDQLQVDILNAKHSLIALEQEVLVYLKQQIIDATQQLHIFAKYVAWLDLYTSHALFAHQKKWTTPQCTQDSAIHVTHGRHPVIEKYLPIEQQFIPNNLAIGSQELGRLHIITGPNMGGKSTFLRQNALIVLLAHCGLCVPAEKAIIGLVDGIFARVGSGDVIAKNQSTFMTEMLEVAHILHNATDRSFIIFDELGRGTSTYDGLALTQAIISHMVKNTQAQTLLATHYHELMALAQAYPSIKNFSVRVYETENEVVFMKQIVPGGADKSYGIDVAQLAGIPSNIIETARQYLQQREEKKSDILSRTATTSKPATHPTNDGGLFAPTPTIDTKIDHPRYEKVKTLLDSYDINAMTPLQALQLLAKLKEEI